MNHHCHCGIFGVFLGFLTGVIWMLLSLQGTISRFFGFIGLGSLSNILNILIALIGFLAFFFFGLFVFRKAWHHVK
ncbi:ABC transporter [Neobacillus fumarioli]|uniref:ABC transporter n=1 Tax=Neobacillus fumarioli TaxID=105229 RepID=UPI0008350DA9|nr:ABC transporter [Neobacillus fumarioli]